MKLRTTSKDTTLFLNASGLSSCKSLTTSCHLWSTSLIWCCFGITSQSRSISLPKSNTSSNQIKRGNSSTSSISRCTPTLLYWSYRISRHRRSRKCLKHLIEITKRMTQSKRRQYRWVRLLSISACCQSRSFIFQSVAIGWSSCASNSSSATWISQLSCSRTKEGGPRWLLPLCSSTSKN